MEYLLGIVTIVLGLLLSIGLHELGHLYPAKKFGVYVPQYMIGFGATLWSKKIGETEYGIKPIPLGGFVRIVGMYPPAPVGKKARKGPFSEMIAQSRQASLEEIPPGQEKRAFYKLSPGKKLLIMFGGPFMNLVLGVLLIAITILCFGSLTPTTTVASVSECIVPNFNQSTVTECSPEYVKTPAAVAGIQSGDEIVAINSQRTASWQTLDAAIAAVRTGDIEITVKRNGIEKTLQAPAQVVARPIIGEDGQYVVSDEGEYVFADRGFLGIAPLQELRPEPVSEVLPTVGQYLSGTTKAVLTLPQKSVDLVKTAMGQKDRDENSVMGIVGVSRIAGEITSADVEGFTGAMTVASLLSLLAGLNIALFVFNLIPLLPLDGGHMAVAVYEFFRKKVYRLRGKEVSGPVDTARLIPVAFVVFGLFIALTLFLVYLDLVMPVSVVN